MKTNDVLQILANTADGVFAVGTDHKIVFWNKSAQNILGYKAKEVLGKSCNEVIAGTDSNGNSVCSRNCNVMKATNKKQTVVNYEVLTHSNKADKIWLNVSIINIPGSQPEHSTVVHIFRDITKQKIYEKIIKEVISNTEIANQLKINLPSTNSVFNGNKPEPRLTSRERQVLTLLADGYPTKYISDKLYIALSTLRKHIRNIYSKLQAHSMLDAVAKARQNNLI